MAVLGNEEHKQRLNLSSYARSVVEMDRSVFDEDGTLSGFLNRVIGCFRELADASIDVAVEERRHNLTQSGYDGATVEGLVKEYRRRLLEKKESYPQGESLTFRLNNKNFSILYDERMESSNYSAPSKYLKALVEEYARLSPSRREQVYYRDLLEGELQPAVDAGYLLSVSVNGRWFWVRPYCVTSDLFNSHLYLVGMSRPEGAPESEEQIASFRVTRLAQVRRRSHPRGRLTADDRRDIEEKIRQVGVQYLIGTGDRICVRLTPKGRREFLQRSYMRPMPERVEKDLYYFSCTAMQVRNYFLSFGADAEVLEPESLRQEFIRVYREALDLYEKS